MDFLFDDGSQMTIGIQLVIDPLGQIGVSIKMECFDPFSASSHVTAEMLRKLPPEIQRFIGQHHDKTINNTDGNNITPKS